jgi:hypothetical protein
MMQGTELKQIVFMKRNWADEMEKKLENFQKH